MTFATVFLYGLFSFATIGFDECFSLWASTSKSLGMQLSGLSICTTIYSKQFSINSIDVYDAVQVTQSASVFSGNYYYYLGTNFYPLSLMLQYSYGMNKSNRYLRM